MKDKINKVIKLVLGINLMSTQLAINLASVMTGIFFVSLAIISMNNYNASFVYINISSVCLSIWIITLQDINSFVKFILEIFRLSIFFILFISSLYNCLKLSLDYASTSIIVVIMSAVGLFICSFYFVNKLISIFTVVKKLFKLIKCKIFNSSSPANSKAKALIENVTAFLISVGGLTVAIKVITESVFQIYSYFK